MNGIGDARLARNLEYLQSMMPTAKAIITTTKEIDRNGMDKVDRRMFSKGTIEKYTQQTKDRENEEEMEIG